MSRCLRFHSLKGVSRCGSGILRAWPLTCGDRPRQVLESCPWGARKWLWHPSGGDVCGPFASSSR